ncbi:MULTISPECIES: ABC transporter ATP-binding protein [Clostridia]|uniref:ABC transporter ATP-binding protein n=1 Tax=Clostridia TaxID=186801 RepID=UPI000EA035F2|nr:MULTISPECIES: ABC transporter ATP-binding protein [Clostridia]NBJ70596.1 ABC transporter ATP-binding protein [Roseburia sp. 1XD42-34]RKI76596.1 ABC transporter ATP-binding protein [Clostridium sp. 1xD42-85]
MTLVLEHVHKVYQDGPKEYVALNDASLQVKAGEFVAIVGPSGSGKSTLLSIAGALLSPTSGKVLLDGENIATLSKKEVTKRRLEKIGFVFQAAHLLPYLKVKDQLNVISVLAHKPKQKKADILAHFGLEHRINNYPNELSGGERQRVAIARALVNDPKLILADEPTASLDSSRGQEVVKLLAKEVNEGNKAGVMVTHDERVLGFADRIITIRDGKVEFVND